MNRNKKSAFVVIIIFVLSVVFNLNFGFLQKLELSSYDLKFLLRGEEELDDRIVVIYLDNEDIKSLGGWPLTKNYYALLVGELENLEPLSIGFSILLEKESFDFPEYDIFFVETIKQYDNIFSVFYFNDITHEKLEEPVINIVEPSLNIFAESFAFGQIFNPPEQKFAESFSGLGFTNLITDIDGKVRKLNLFAEYAGKKYPSFPLCTAGHVLKKETGSNEFHFDNNKLRIGNITVDNIEDGIGIVNFKSSTNSVTKYSFLEIWDIINNGDTGSLKNKIFLISVIAEGKSIPQSFPLENNSTFSIVFANVIDNIIKNDFLTDIGFILSWLFSIIIALLMLFMIIRFPGAKGILFGLSFFGLFFLVNIGVLFFDIYMEFVPGFLLNIAAFLAGISFLFSEEKVKREHLEEAKDEIEISLAEKENILKDLQKELIKIEKEKEDSVIKNEIIEKIHVYREEINNLKSRIKDEEIIKVSEPEELKEQKYPGIIYNPAGKMEAILDLAEKIANENIPVLISGDSGTGKELIARTIHNISKKKDNPFIAVNCGALTETLLESELFGHQKGAFTGAVSDKKGRFELADGGTLFLDEITETSLAFQVKLLRILQEGEFERVGGEVTKKVDVRVITATNKDIKSVVNEGEFREDLYFRINAFNIKIPPLKERLEDLDILIKYFISREGFKDIGISKLAFDSLKNYGWPGNVRELENSIKRALIFANSENRNVIKISDLPEEIQKSVHEHSKTKDNLPDIMLEKLREEGFGYGSVSRTADQIGGMNRGTVSEYFRGMCFEAFVNSNLDVDLTAVSISDSSDSKILENVKKKMNEFLNNAVELVDINDSLKINLERSKPKYTNLPKIYHEYLNKIIEAYLNNEWQTD
ncbi:sigma 54-interacting transcriptional regulator [candidate division KSB1 bacterium]